MTAKLLYWISTGLIALVMTFGGIVDAMQTPEALAIIHRLGYPDYFLTMLGVAKLLGVIALLAPVPRWLREWAYAGFTFDLIAAVISHIAVSDPMSDVAVAAGGLVVVQISAWSWRRRTTSAGERAGAAALVPARS